jgi:DNA repair exonuclease SbcCD nuclease subunit
MKILHISDLHYHESSDAWALLKEAASALGEGRSKEKSQRVRNKVNQCR